MSFNFNQIGIQLPDNWTTKRVCEVADINADSIKKGDEPSEIWYVDISSVSSGFLEQLKKIKYCDAPSRAKRRLKNNDFLISTVRPKLRQHVFLENVGENWIASTGLCVVSTHKSENAWYLYSFITSDIFNDYLVRIADGGAYPAFNPKEIANAIIPWPDETTMKKINQLMKFFYNKIELNNEINNTLESISQAIFKSWFIDFDPVTSKISVLKVGGTIDDAERAAMSTISGKSEIALIQMQEQQPEAYMELKKTAALFPAAMQESVIGEKPSGWKVGNLADILEFNPKRTLTKGTIAPYLDMKNVPTKGHLVKDVIEREMNGGTKFINGDTLLARITPCLENGKTAYVDFLKEAQVGWGSTEYIVIHPRKGYHPLLGYFIARNETFRSAAIQSMTGSSGRQRADINALADLTWLIYPKDLINIFTKIVEPFLNTAKNNSEESKILARIRDALLPKFISGEIKFGITDRDHTEE
ncbi:restriction endonuclease subunit S [Paenibacillus sp. B1-33]|uniref:restriction endonuclease subunit S n=1 Tax=unclassified Paenibacillus TaxID=185978 RepID=UPI003D2DB8CC